jgi:hypothetical protein
VKRESDPYATRSAKALTRVLIDLQLIDRSERVRIVSLHPGRNQRALGAWRWTAWREDYKPHLGVCPRIEVCGSQWTVRQIIEAHANPKMRVDAYRDRWGDTCLYPEPFQGDEE